MLTNTPLVSVIVPVYNSESYINTTLNSLLIQTYNNIEIIIVDDGSTDKSKHIISKLLKNNPNLKYIYQENAGAPAARNNGLKHSNGTYVIFFDADDIMLEDAIANFIAASNSGEKDLIIGNFARINKDDLIIKTHSHKVNHIIKLLKTTKISKDKLIKHLTDIEPVPANKMIKKNFLKQNNIKFDELKIGQDLNFYLKTLAYFPKIGFVNEAVFYYRIHDNSISSTYNHSIVDVIKVFNLIKEQNLKFYNDNPKILQTLKFKNLLLQISKVPKIFPKTLRIEVSNLLISELKLISGLDLELLGKFPIVKIVVAKIVCIFQKILTSSTFSKIYITLSKKM